MKQFFFLRKIEILQITRTEIDSLFLSSKEPRATFFIFNNFKLAIAMPIFHTIFLKILAPKDP
jgi:hypothetical protein